MDVYALLDRALRQFSHKEVALALGVDPKTVRRWQVRETEPKPYIADAIRQRLLPLGEPVSGPAAFRFIDLFAGVGGIRIPFEKLGGRCVFTSEWDAYAQKTYAANFHDGPEHMFAGDITQVHEKDVPDHDVLLAGFPCQPFSLGGKQMGMSDERWMWPAFEAVIRAVRPRYVLVENVSALVRDGRAWGTVLTDLHRLGFNAEWATLSAAEFGAPTPRERVYLLAYTPSLDGEPRDRLGTGGVGGSPLATRGLSGLDAHSRRRAASEWLAREPRVDRLVDGVPRQVDRLRGLGNAVVPAAAERIGRLVMEHEREAA